MQAGSYSIAVSIITFWGIEIENVTRPMFPRNAELDGSEATLLSVNVTFRLIPASAMFVPARLVALHPLCRLALSKKL